MHRTTILLDPEIEKSLKKKAQLEGKSVTELIQTYVRNGLNQTNKPASSRQISLPIFSMGVPVVDPSDRSRLWNLMDEK